MARKKPTPTKPEKVFRLGYVSASIFARKIEGDEGSRTIRSVNVQKRYVDGEETKYTSSFSLAELPLVLRVLELAQQHMEACEAEVQLD